MTPKFKTSYPDARILLVDDEPIALRAVSTALGSSGYEYVETLEDSRGTLEELERKDYSCVLLDLRMPHVSGTELLPGIVHGFPDTMPIVMTGVTDLDTVVSCMRSGAFDYLPKPIDKPRLLASVEKALQARFFKIENAGLRRGLLEGAPRNPNAFQEIVTDHPRMKSIFSYAEAIAGSPYPVLILGENGTGKELLARSLFKLSGRKGEFVAVNVGGLDDTLFSDTLFGHSKGAYTSADKERGGMVKRAEGGVLFLDEIGDLENSSQIKLLRLLQEGEYHALGTDTVSRTNAKFIFSTNRDLEKATAEGKFRQDLYFRLKTHTIHLSPLRERLGDLPLLIKHFIEKHARLCGKPPPGYLPQLLEFMRHYHFPGNVRELESMIADAVASTSHNFLPLEPFLKNIQYKGPAPREGEDYILDLTVGQKALPALKDMERAYIDHVVRHADNNLGVAAKILGMNYTSLYRRLKKQKENHG